MDRQKRKDLEAEGRVRAAEGAVGGNTFAQHYYSPNESMQARDKGFEKEKRRQADVERNKRVQQARNKKK